MIIARYLIKEITQTLFGVCLILMLIGLSGQLVGLFAEVTAGNLSVNTVMIVLGLKTLKMLLVIFPLSLYLSVLMTLSQLYQNNEMAAISACGISQGYILRSVLSIALLFAFLVGTFSLQIVPWANLLQEKIVTDSKSSTDLEGMTAGRFKEMSSGVGVMYIEDINKERTELQNVFIQRKIKKNETVIRANKGHQMVDETTGDRFMVLEKGVRFETGAGKNGYTVIEFEKHGVRIHEKSDAKIQKKFTAMPTIDLLKSKLAADKSKSARNKRYSAIYTAELHSRIAPIFLCLLLAALAVPLSKTSPRQGRYARLGLGLVIYIVFNNFIYVGKNWISLGTVPQSLGLWWVHGTLLLLVIFLFMQQTGFKYLFSKMSKSSKT